MDGEQRVEAVAASFSTSSDAERMGASVVREEPTDARLGRIIEYLQSSLDKQDALQANLNAANADLMAIAYKLAAAIKTAMATGPASLEAYEELGPAISSLLRIHKQVERFSQLDKRLTSTSASVALLKTRASAVVDQNQSQ
jgi:hypothetical protein